MFKKEIGRRLTETIERLSEKPMDGFVYLPHHEKPMPSADAMQSVVLLLRRVLFPGYFGDSTLQRNTVQYYVGVNIEKMQNLLAEQIRRGICFDCEAHDNSSCTLCENDSQQLASKFIERLPELRQKLSFDVKAAYDGDPAAKSLGEIIYCYPVIRALVNHRVAHELLKMGIPLLPRLIAEMAHSETGIDIHPGATIGESFTIDHGTGVVIGETCIIGRNVKIYQGVTLGAKSFPLDENGNPIKGIARHPIVEDDVVIYAGATILGRITIGKGSQIGGNVWVTNDVPPYSKVAQRRPKEMTFSDGGGI